MLQLPMSLSYAGFNAVECDERRLGRKGVSRVSGFVLYVWLYHYYLKCLANIYLNNCRRGVVEKYLRSLSATTIYSYHYLRTVIRMLNIPSPGNSILMLKFFISKEIRDFRNS